MAGRRLLLAVVMRQLTVVPRGGNDGQGQGGPYLERQPAPGPQGRTFVELGSPEHETALAEGHDAIGQQNDSIYGDMAQLGEVLDAMSERIRCLQPTSDRTLNLIRQMKNLRTELEMEVLKRRGW